jgi:hypothetical protein
MNWIKMTSNLDTKPEVMQMADLLKVPELHVVGLLWKLWTWLDQNITDCYAATVTRPLLDRITMHGMSDALAEVGWLSGEDGALKFPNWDRHNGQTAKERACSSKRMKDKRARDAVTPPLRSDRNTTVTREEKRREEKSIPPNPPNGGQADPRHHSITSRIKAEYKAATGHEMAFDGGRDGKALTKFLTGWGGTTDQFFATARAAWAKSKTPFASATKHSHTLHGLCTNFGAITAEANQKTAEESKKEERKY